ncbi:MAG: DUF4136 domain-containing protein [Rhizobacter sp.]|nr:DUF4136 domain-containing protein [Ferruginibacter sp.]
MKKVKFSFLVLAGSVALITSSCRKDVTKNLSDAESRVYITKHDSTVNFANYQTFRIADSVSVIKDGKFVTHAYNAYDSSMIAALTQEMIQRGYQLQTDDTVVPDLGINVSRIITDYTGNVSYGDYWGGYGNYWDPYYWGYRGYGYYFPYAFGTYTFREGALSVDMLDLKNPNTSTNKLNTIWTGLGRGTGIFNVSNVNEETQALFNQSTYMQQ